MEELETEAASVTAVMDERLIVRGPARQLLVDLTDDCFSLAQELARLTAAWDALIAFQNSRHHPGDPRSGGTGPVPFRHVSAAVDTLLAQGARLGLTAEDGARGVDSVNETLWQYAHRLPFAHRGWDTPTAFYSFVNETNEELTCQLVAGVADLVAVYTGIVEALLPKIRELMMHPAAVGLSRDVWSIAGGHRAALDMAPLGNSLSSLSEALGTIRVLAEAICDKCARFPAAHDWECRYLVGLHTQQDSSG